MLKGTMLIEAFRAERLKQQQALRGDAGNGEPPEQGPGAFEPMPSHPEPDDVPAAEARALDTSREPEPVPPRAHPDEAGMAGVTPPSDRVDPAPDPAPVPVESSRVEGRDTAASCPGFDLPQASDPGLTSGATHHASTVAPCTCNEQHHDHDLGRPDLRLAGIGIGPAMTIRLGQLGLHSISDLAAADAGILRVLLGDISRLIDVEAWIDAARRKLDRPGQ